MADRAGDTPLEGHAALVTGASRGIGRATARALAGAGARVYLVGRSRDVLEPLADELGGEALPADLADDTDVWAMAERLLEVSGGPPDLVVNSAGFFSLSPMRSTSVQDFDRNVGINLRGTFLVIRALLPPMLERRSGLIVNIGSVAGWRAFPENAAYSASKFGLRGLHDVLLEELRGTGVRATLVEPAACDTALWDPLDPDADPALPDRAAMLRPEDVAQAVLFAATRPPEVQLPLLRIEHV